MPAIGIPQLVPVVVQVVVGLGMGALFAWIAFTLTANLETRIDYPDRQRSGKVPALTIALMPPGKPDPAKPRVAVTMLELPEFLKKKPGHQPRLPPIGTICWPEHRAHGSVTTCATVTPMLDGSQRIEVVETKEGLSEYRSLYTVSDKGSITPHSYRLKNELHTMMRLAAAGLALAAGLWLGFSLGGRLARRLRMRFAAAPLKAARIPPN